MTLDEKYECECELMERPGSPDRWWLGDPTGALIAEVPGDWTKGEIEAFLDGWQVGLTKGREQGRIALQMEIATLLGGAKTW